MQLWNCSARSFLLYRKTRQKARINGVENERFLRGKIVHRKGICEKDPCAGSARRAVEGGFFAEKEGLSTKISTLWKHLCGISGETVQ